MVTRRFGAKSERGFTILELVTTLSIIAILLALALPQYMGFKNRAIIAEGMDGLSVMKGQEWDYYMSHHAFTADLAQLGGSPIQQGSYTFTIESADDERVVLRATGKEQTRAFGYVLDLTLLSNGQSTLNITRP